MEVIQDLERLLAFMRAKCSKAFGACYESRGWPTIGSLVMLEGWVLRKKPGETQMVEMLREIEHAFKEGYFSFRCSEHISATHEIAWMELAKELGTVKGYLAQERDT